ncbi:hypothetical protein A3H09_03360 [Candidatus Falkowbacteria bacterium RIFCSPLOWO2_12_FULL_45_13]|uniref:tRNA N6-adenosine threonylcarbamoyltransferase n=2 Tax=Candidatus Falkowiibacteriota TaxID=1752728 RepID=A0A1F5SCF0_9BACT|nr:MAG: hypothetical protein A3H66_00625 [Candidatus Falkowbacteria bacterium RIFCSPLOWO2_02_FULL_45_21]OGF30212.1 MAG: hypothetical protein A3H09_03360 [Candidatus Falkowbacteria bacterium RIFCSPLOWO2_12_FULL_45_13]
MIILGIETSCDETAAAVVRGNGDNFEVLSNVVSSQTEIHKKYGGVVPEVAARTHVLNILPVVNQALEKADLTPTLSLARRGGKSTPFRSPFTRGANKVIDAIAVTVGPGLITSLMVGVETAKVLAYVWRLPAVAINHIEGHIYANWLEPIRVNPKSEIRNPKQISNHKFQIQNKIKFPAIILTVSGGHTMLALMSGHGKYKVLGETRDDAAGEAFDKAAQLLGLGYPGGPEIARLAEEINSFKKINPKSQIPNPNTQLKFKIENLKLKIFLPRPMIRDRNFDFSFSGLKTALLYALEKDKDWRMRIPEYAAEFQQAAVDVLVHKTIKAAKTQNCRTVMLSGGVAANLELRSQLAVAVKKNLPLAKYIMPDLKYCTDNAAMIAAAGYFRARRKDFTPWQKLKTDANLELR